MISTGQERNLTDIYFIIRDNPGWLADCHQVGYPQDQLNYLESLADEFDRYQPEKEAEVYFKLFPTRQRNCYPCGQLSEWKVIQARKYPLDKLVPPNRQKKIHCPFGIHRSDTMGIKNGRGQ